MIATLSDRRRAIQVRKQRIHLDSSRSLSRFLSHVVIDSRPQKLRWCECWEPWQRDIVRPMIPAIEQMAGLRTGYEGPRYFLCVMPRGHDKTGLLGRIANWATAYSRHEIRGYAAAGTKEQAGLLLDSMQQEISANSWLAERLNVTYNVISGPGGKMRVVSADAKHQSGHKPDLVVCDEWSFWDSRELFDMLLSGMEKRPQSVFVIISNAGLKGSWQWELLQKWKSDPNWRVYEAPAGRKLASWMTQERIDAMRSSLRPQFARRVIDNVWITATERPLLSEAAILGCCEDGVLWSQHRQSVLPRRRRLFLGIDFGRTRDRTVVWTWELVAGVMLCREIVVLENVPFAEQERLIESRLTPEVERCLLDKGAQGWTTVENLERTHPGVCEGVFLSDSLQGQVASLMKTAVASRSIRLPSNDPQMVADFQLVGEVETVSGRPKLSTRRDDEIGHADRFWAAGLGLLAAPADKSERVVPPPRGRRGR